MGEVRNRFIKHFEKYPHHTKYIPEFESDVTTNPYWNQTRRRIDKIEKEVDRYPPGCFRWSKSDLRIVYLPDEPTHTIVPLDASTAADVAYKK